MAAKSPNGVLRTPNTINKFKAVANSNPGGQNPLLIYFSKIRLRLPCILPAAPKVSLGPPKVPQWFPMVPKWPPK